MPADSNGVGRPQWKEEKAYMAKKSRAGWKLQMDPSEDPEETFFRDLVRIAYLKAGEPFDEDRDLKPLAEQPAHVLQEIVDVQVRFHRSGEYDDDGRPMIEVSYSFKFRDWIKKIKELDTQAEVFRR